MKTLSLVLSMCVIFLPACAIAQDQLNFQVMLDNKPIGTLTAVQKKSNPGLVRELKTETSTKVLLVSVHMESEVTINKDNEVLVEGTAYRHANRGPDDVHAHVKRIGDKIYQRTRNGEVTTLQNEDIRFCVVDLYFSEPVGLTSVFSNMYGERLQLKQLGNGSYELVTPDKKNTTYIYNNGNLISVEVSTPVGKVVSKRM